MGKDSATEVELILMNVSSGEMDDDEPSTVARILDRLLSRASCHEASDWLKNGTSSRSIEDIIRKDVERFVRTRDKLLALAAILLKSRAFFKATHNVANKEMDTILVRLPRTMHNKPYIPRRKCKDDDDANLSISHQFPFVGSAQRVRQEGEPSLKIGFDIVVQDPLNTRLYDTWDDFLAVFQEAFCSEEWALIVSMIDAEARLHEFLLRWAAKEAYTKALGVGLGFDFASFHLQFELPESCRGKLHDYLRSSQREDSLSPIRVRGKVAADQWTQVEVWDFYVGSLSRDAWTWFCVAVGPVVNASQSNLQVRWTTLEQLIPEQKIQDTHN